MLVGVMSVVLNCVLLVVPFNILTDFLGTPEEAVFVALLVEVRVCRLRLLIVVDIDALFS